MPTTRLFLTALALTEACFTPDPATDGVFVDGRFDEWSAAATILDDSADEPESAIDVRSILGLDDAGWFYLSLDLGREVNVQSLPGTLHLLIDADADSVRTGGTLHGMDGVDLVLELSQTDDPLVVGRGSGFALRTVSADGTKGAVVRYALGVTVAPSWGASRVELRMSRRGAVGLPALGTGLRLKAVYVVEDRVGEETRVGSYTFRTAMAEPTPSSSGDRLAKSEGSVRVAQLNVSEGSFLSNREGFARILGAIAPDVILLDEVTGAVSPNALENFFALKPLSDLGAWRFVLGQGGGRQRTVVAARDREIRAAASMRRVSYADGALEALNGISDAGFDRLLEWEAERDLSATGAWVEVSGQDVLFVPLDLQSAGWVGSPQDRLRTLQAQTIHDHILTESGRNGRPVVIGGDLNLVGSLDPLLTLIQGLDVDGSDLAPVDAPRIGERTYVTWRNARGLFAPGRLDFLFVPDAVATVTNSFVFGTEDFDPEMLRRLNLERELSASISDHLVVTVDLSFR